MPDANDMDLVREFARTNSEAAFAELVRRHINLVHSVARRLTSTDGDAQDVTQAVFIILARKAGSLREKTLLTGWLYETTRFAAARLRRTNARRYAREQEAYMQSTLNEADSADAWEKLSPHLETAMDKLAEHDRALLVLRFYENKTGPEAAALLGIREDAAHKRLTRALEKLRKIFAQRGVALTATAIAGAVSGNSIQAAPAGLAAIISAAALSGTTITTTALIAATKAIAMTTLQKTLITTALVATVGAGIFEAHQVSQLRAQNQTLQQQQQPMAEQLTNLQSENERLSNLVAGAKDQKSLSEAQFSELLKLRGKSGQAQTAVQETAKLRTALQQSTASSKFTSDALAQGTAMLEQIKKKNELAKLARMKDKLNLTDSQQQAISDIITKNSEARAQQSLIAMSGKRTPEQIKAAMIASLQTFGNEEAEVKAVLTPDQLAAYPDYQQSETLVAANNRANLEATMMRSDLNLSQDQQDKVNNALYQFALDHSANKLASSLVVQKPGNVADTMNSLVEVQQQELADKLKVLGGILTPDQLQSYRQSQLEKIDSMASAAKFFLPQMTNGAAQ